MKKPAVSIVVGALNEERRIGKTLDKLRKYLGSHHILESTEIIVVTADATDKTHSIVADKLKKFPTYQHLKPGPKVGKGRDIAYGMMHSRGKLCIYMDADLATPVNYISVVVALHKEFPDDIIIGTRDLKRIHKGLRSLMSLFGNIAFKLGTGVYIRDTQCGFKAFNREHAHKIFSKLVVHGWGFDMEVLALAKTLNIRIRELPIPDWHDVPGGTLANNKLRVSLKTFRELLSITKKYRLKTYEKMLSEDYASVE